MYFLNSSLSGLFNGKQEKPPRDRLETFFLCLALTRGLGLLRPQWTGETVTQSPEEMRHKKGLCVTDRLYTRVYCRKNEKLTVQAFPVRLMSTHTLTQTV